MYNHANGGHLRIIYLWQYRGKLLNRRNNSFNEELNNIYFFLVSPVTIDLKKETNFNW